MIKKLSLLFGCVFLINSFCLAQWVSISKNSVPDSKPNVQLISDDITGTVIKIDLPGFRVDEFNAEGKTYHSINFGCLKKITHAVFPKGQ